MLDFGVDASGALVLSARPVTLVPGSGAQSRGRVEDGVRDEEEAEGDDDHAPRATSVGGAAEARPPVDASQKSTPFGLDPGHEFATHVRGWCAFR